MEDLKHETNTFSNRDVDCNGNAVQIGRMVRAWRDYNNVPMSGMLIDTLDDTFQMNAPHTKVEFSS